MLNDRIRVLVITPYAGLNHIVAAVSADYENVEMNIFEGDLAAGAEIAYRMRNSGYDIIISRGSTAKLIRESVRIPVIDIGYSGYDFISALTMGKNLLKNPVVVISDKLKSRVEMIVNVLELGFPVIGIPKDTEREAYEPILNGILEENRSIISYSNVVYKEARQLGIPGILIVSGEESVREAIDTALQTAEIVRGENRWEDIFKKTMRMWNEHVFVVEKGQLIYTNLESPEGLEGVMRQLAAHSMLDPMNSRETTLVTMNNEQYSVLCSMLDPDRELMLFRLFKAVREFSGGAFFSYAAAGVDFNVQCAFPRKTLLRYESTGRRCYENRYSIHLFGPSGSKKHVLAYHLFRQNSTPGSVFFRVFCRMADAESFNELRNEIHRNSGPLHTVYLERIEFLERDAQEALMGLMKEADKLNILFISSAEQNLTGKLEEGRFPEILYNALTETEEVILPLSKRKEAIEELASNIVTDLNNKASDRIVRINADAMVSLKGYSWPLNVMQLERVLRTAAANMDGFVVRKADVDMAIEKEKSSYVQASEVRLEGTLDQIRKNVAERVLAEENMNQARAARRLGISRTTLWKLLKDE